VVKVCTGFFVEKQRCVAALAGQQMNGLDLIVMTVIGVVAWLAFRKPDRRTWHDAVDQWENRDRMD